MYYVCLRICSARQMWFVLFYFNQNKYYPTYSFFKLFLQKPKMVNVENGMNSL